MRQVTFLIPGSPNEAFFSQVSAFSKAVKLVNWERWRPTVRAIFGGYFDIAAFSRWQPFLSDVECMFLSPDRTKRDGYFAQGDTRFLAAPHDADVVVLSDADTLIVSNIEDALDQVAKQNAIAGCIAHFGFPVEQGHSQKSDWDRIAQQTGLEPLRFEHSYSLADRASPPEALLCPFYINFGVVFVSQDALRRIKYPYLDLRRDLAGNLYNKYFSGQVALALCASELRIQTIELPLRFNFPNDTLAETLHPNELNHVRIIHYLRTTYFDRQKIFISRSEYSNFLSKRLTGSNKILQTYIREAFGPQYPF